MKGTGSLNLGNLAKLVIPLLLLANNKRELNLNLKLDENFESKSELIENIKPYFSFQEQATLNKVRDIIDIFNKVSKIKNSSYKENSVAITSELPYGDKKEKILTEMSKHLDGKGKDMADNLIIAKQMIEKARSNVYKHKKVTKAQLPNRTEKMVNLLNCLEPILPDKSKKRMKKIDELYGLIKKPESDF